MGNMPNPSELGKSFGARTESLRQNFRLNATKALPQIRAWIPHLNENVLKRTVAAGSIALLSACTAPTTAETPGNNPVAVATATETVKSDIFAKVFTPDKTPPDLTQKLNSEIKSPVTKIVGIEADDQKDPTKTADFWFVETKDTNTNYVMFKGTNGYIVSSYKVGATVNPKDGGVNVEYITGNGQTFIDFVLNKHVPKNPGESDADYQKRTTLLLSDPSYRDYIEQVLKYVGEVKSVTFTDPVSNETVSLSTNDLIAQAIQAISQSLSPDIAYAKDFPPSSPTPSSTLLVETQTAVPTVTDIPTTFPTPTSSSTPIPHPNTPTLENPTPIPTLSPAEIQQKAVKIADDMTYGQYAVVPKDLDAARKQIIHDAIEEAVFYAPYGVTADQLNDFIKSQTGGRDLRKEFDTQYSKYGITFNEVADVNLLTPDDLFNKIIYIGPFLQIRPADGLTYWHNDGIYLASNAIQPGNYLIMALVKEAIGNHVGDNVRDIVVARANTHKQTLASFGQGRVGGTISFALDAYMMGQHPNLIKGAVKDIGELIDMAFQGGIVQGITTP